MTWRILSYVLRPFSSFLGVCINRTLQSSQGDEDSDEDEDDEDDEEGSDENEDGLKSKVALGKRKAHTRSSKPPKKGPEKKARRGPRVEVEYEHEMESVPLTKEALANW